MNAVGAGVFNILRLTISWASNLSAAAEIFGTGLLESLAAFSGVQYGIRTYINGINKSGKGVLYNSPEMSHLN